MEDPGIGERADMSFNVVPCPICQGFVVTGEPNCRSCGQKFDYGPVPPPVPTPAEISAALQQQPASAGGEPVRQQAQQPVGGAPTDIAQTAAAFLDTGRYDDLTQLAAADQLMDGLEPTHFESPTQVSSRASDVPGFVPTEVELAAINPQNNTGISGQPRESMVSHSDWGGMLEQGLYASAVPDQLETPSLTHIERFDTANKLSPSYSDSDASQLVVCTDCGTPFDASLCPACGVRRTTEI
jgi:hypothetical protein